VAERVAAPPVLAELAFSQSSGHVATVVTTSGGNRSRFPCVKPVDPGQPPARHCRAELCWPLISTPPGQMSMRRRCSGRNEPVRGSRHVAPIRDRRSGLQTSQQQRQRSDAITSGNEWGRRMGCALGAGQRPRVCLTAAACIWPGRVIGLYEAASHATGLGPGAC